MLHLCLGLWLLLALEACLADLNEDLWVAARKGDAAAVKALLAKGADVNTRFLYGGTALYYAAARGHTEVVKVLLVHGAQVHVRDDFGATALSRAVGKGHAEIIRMLLEKGAAEGEGKEEALLAAVDSNNVAVVRTLLDKGGFSPEALSLALHNATRKNGREIADLLQKAGARPPPKADFQVDLETLQSYAGAYEGPAGEFTFTVKEGKLVGGPPGYPLPMSALDEATFRPAEWVGITIAFKREKGKVTGFVLRRRGNDTFYGKVDGK